MKGVSHALVGLSGVLSFHALVVPLAPGLTDLAVVSAVGVAASLLPDVDSDEATIRQITGTARSGGCVGRLVSGIVYLLGGHRGALTHSLLAWAIASFVAGVYFRGNMSMVAFAIGYLSHLIADALTVEGVPLLWPLWPKRIRLLPALLAIRTGGAREYMAMVGLGVFMVLVVFGRL